MCRRWLGATILTLGLVVLIPRVLAQVSPGAGVVIDHVTGQPIPGATVTMTCNQYGPFHYTKTTEHVRESGANGEFSFSSRDVFGCDSAGVRARKVGYEDLTYVGLLWENFFAHQVAGSVRLIKNEDVVIVRLGALKPGRFDRGHELGEYESWFMAFAEAIRIAETRRELAVIEADGYCTRLQALWSGLTEAQRAKLAVREVNGRPYRVEFTIKPLGNLQTLQFDHAEVLAFCSGAARNAGSR